MLPKRNKILSNFFSELIQQKYLKLVLVSVIAISIAVTVLSLQHSQSIEQRASTVNPIKHIVFMVKENRTFDNYFGTFPGANGSTTYTGSDGKIHTLNHQGDTIPGDINHEPWYAHAAYDNGKMDLFSKTQGAIQNVNGVPTDEADSQVYQADIPNYWQYAQKYTLLDNYFSEIMGPSFANHLTTIAGFTDNVDSNPKGNIRNAWGCDSTDPNSKVEERMPNGTVKWVKPCFNDFQTLGDMLNNANIGWKYYAAGFGIRGYGWSVYNAVQHDRFSPTWNKNVVDYSTFAQDAQNGTLPTVSWLTEDSANSDHPPFSICQGENWTVNQINAIMKNPSLWNSTAIVLTWDDWGGFYDHVPPPHLIGGNSAISYGFRVPGIIISPYAKAHSIDATLYSNGSLLAFTEKLLQLPPLGGFDTNAIPFTNAFDFTQQPLPPLILQPRNCSGNPSGTPTPSPSLSPSPNPSPSVSLSPTPILTVVDNFRRQNQMLWGTAADGYQWGADANILANFSIKNNIGIITTSNSSDSIFSGILGPQETDSEVNVQGSSTLLNENIAGSQNNTIESGIGATLRWVDNKNFYRASIAGKYLSLIKKFKGTRSVLAKVPFTAVPNALYTIRFRIVGNKLYAMSWASNFPQPSNWMVSATDTTFSKGYGGIRTYLKNGASARYTFFSLIPI